MNQTKCYGREGEILFSTRSKTDIIHREKSYHYGILCYATATKTPFAHFILILLFV